MKKYYVLVTTPSKQEELKLPNTTPKGRPPSPPPMSGRGRPPSPPPQKRPTTPPEIGVLQNRPPSPPGRHGRMLYVFYLLKYLL